MSVWGSNRRSNQPLARGLLRSHYNGRPIGSSIVATNPHTTDDGFGLTLGGSIPRGTREYTFWQGDGTDNIAYARTTKPYVITTGSENQPCTFVVVFKMQTTAASNTTIAGLGAQTGAGGSTLFRLMGGTSAASLYLQVQDGGGTSGYNAQLTTPVAVNDLRWHTAVVTFDMVVGGNARCYVDGVAPSASLNFGAGNYTSNTTFDYVSVCGLIRGGSPLAYGPFDVALFVPIFGAKLSDQEAKSLSSNPWQLFRNVIDSVALAEVAASGGGDIVGSQTLTLTNTGTVTGAGALDGSNAISIANTGAITGAGALAGSESITFTQSAELLGFGDLAGTNAITFTNTGTLDAPAGSMVGTNAITITNTGTLLGDGALAGVDVITIANDGELTATGTLAGTNALTFTNTGALELPGAISGLNVLTTGQSGVLTGLGELVGTNAMAFTNTLFNAITQQTETGAGASRGKRKGFRFERYIEPKQLLEDVEEKLEESLKGKPKIKKKVAQVIAQTVASVDESPDTASQRFVAAMEAMREPIRGDYLDAITMLVAFAKDRLTDRGVLKDIPQDLDEETIATVVLLLS